jgi:transcriptional regulator with XRE-family HTH domain
LESRSLQADCLAANHLYGLSFKSAARKAITSSGVVALAFANLSGHKGGYIGKIENAKHAATIDMIEAIAEALGVEAQELLKPRI